jgi:acyl-CoA thioester hydrolase
LLFCGKVAARPRRVKCGRPALQRRRNPPLCGGAASVAANSNGSLMLERPDLEPVFVAAPLVSPVMKVEPEWIDYNGHLNMAYYNVLFDRAVDEAYELMGCGLAYLKETRHSTFTAEAHIRYLRELHAGAPVRVTLQLLDFDAKRMHYFEQLFHADEGWLSATSENMVLNVDMTAKKVAPFPDYIAARLAQMKAAHARLPAPDGVGRRIAMPGKA